MPGLKASALTPAEPAAASAGPVWVWVATSHSSVAPSLSAVASVPPLVPNVRVLTASPVTMAAPAWPPGPTFQSRAVPSWPPVASSLPSGLKASASTSGPFGIRAAPATCWLAVSHSWTFPSLLAAASSVPLGLNATASTGLASELIGGPISCPVAAFHSRTVPSEPPVASVLPSGLNITALPCAGLASGRVLIAAWWPRFHVPTVAAPAASSSFPPSAKDKASGAAPKEVTLIAVCEARSHSWIAPLEYPAARVAPSGTVGQRGDHPGRPGQDAADRLRQRLEQAVTGLRRRVQPPGCAGQQRGGDRVSGVQVRALRGQVLRRVRGALPGRRGPRVLDRYPGAGQCGHDHHGQQPGQGLVAPPSASRGPAAGPQKFRLVRAQRRVPVRVPGPDARRLPDGGQLHAAVQQRAVVAAAAPPRRVLGELAAQDRAGLVFGQPALQPRPGLEQDIMRDLALTGVQDQQTAPGERLQDDFELGILTSAGLGRRWSPRGGPACGLARWRSSAGRSPARAPADPRSARRKPPRR